MTCAFQTIDDEGGGGRRHFEVGGELAGLGLALVQQVLQGGDVGDMDAEGFGDLFADLAGQGRDQAQVVADWLARRVCAVRGWETGRSIHGHDATDIC